jgi:hypothetical protein
VLIENTELSTTALEEFYVCKRLVAIPPDNRDALVRRVPDDVRALAEASADQEARADALELDFIDFLLTYKGNRILSVIGSVGVGKTTFLRYVLQSLRAECASLRPYVPVFINCVALASPHPEYHDLLFEIVGSVEQVFLGKKSDVSTGGKSDPAIGVAQTQSLLADYRQLGFSLRNASDIVEFLQRLRRVCQEGCEPVVIFDNVDQLKPEVVADIVALARSVHLRTGLCVITAMRPATHSTQVELQRGNGAFYSYYIEITPPDLRPVIRRRLKRALSNVGSLSFVNPKGATFVVDDPERALSSIIEKVLTPKVQEIFLRDLFNNDLRHALIGFSAFLKYRELRPELMFEMRPTSGKELEPLLGSWFDHLIDGMMISDQEHYSEGQNSPITNLLQFEYQGRLDYLVQYTCLSLLGWAGRFVERRTMVEWLQTFGYDADMSIAVIRRLLGRRLLYSPEVERPTELDSVHSVKLSTSGQYYLDHLIQHPQYIYNVVYDIDLPHAGYKDFASDGFFPRMTSVSELIETVFAAEIRQLTFLLESKRGIYLLGAIKNAGLLTRRLLTAAEELLEGGRHSRFEGPRQASVDMLPRLRELDANLKSGELRIEDELRKHHFAPAVPKGRKTVEQAVGRSNNIRLNVPLELAPSLPNRVGIEVDLNGIKEVNPVVLYWRGLSEHGRFEEITELRRHHERATYEGEFAIREVDTISPFPASSVTVFAGSDPVLVTRVRAPDQLTKDASHA